jgi:hypothetical protein
MEREAHDVVWNRAFETARARGADYWEATEYADQSVKSAHARGELLTPGQD